MCIFKLTHLTQFSQMLHLAVELKYDYQSIVWKEYGETAAGETSGVN